jgi:type I restriction enzyme S subunit
MSPVVRRIPYGTDPPDRWDVTPLRYLATLSNGYAFKSETWQEFGTPILRIENLNGSKEFNYSDIDLGDRYRVGAGDLLFSWSGNPGTSFGPFRWNTAGVYFLNQHIFKVSVHGCDKNWLYWSLKAATHWIERELTSGMIGMVHVTKAELTSIPIPVPPIAEQRRIADFLDAEVAHIDAIRAVRAEQRRLLSERWLAELSAVMSDAGKEHGEVALRRVAIRIEQGWSPQCEDAEAEPDEWAVLKTSAVSSGKFDPLAHKLLPPSVLPDIRYRLRDGDLLLTRGSGSSEFVGMAAVVDTQGRQLLLSDLLYRLDLSAGWSSRYAAYALKSQQVRQQIAAMIRGASGLTIKLRGEDILSLEVPAVPVDSQEAMARTLRVRESKYQDLIERIDRSNALLAESRQALITAAVTGQFDVTTARGVSLS